MVSDFDWTAEAVAHLRTLWTEGHSTAAIGRRMGISKNAVVGKAHRLHLPPRPSPIQGKGTGERPLARERARIRRGGPSLLPHAAGSAPPPLPQAAPPADRPAAPTAPRPARQEPCCWPIGEPRTRGFRYCDAPAHPGKPYCAEHAGAAYVPMQAARGRPDDPGLERSLRRLA
jgi:GcrA cell cycle regulator